MRKIHTAIEGSLVFRIGSFLTYNCIAIPAMCFIAYVIYGMRVKERRKLRQYKSAILASNHCQYIEPGLEAVAIWPRKILFSAEENNVTRKDVGLLTRLLRAIGIPESSPMAIAPTIKKALKNKWLVNVYPEGTIGWRSQDPGKFMDGFFFLAYLNDAPIFPVAEVLHERAIRKIFPWWPPRTSFVFCDPVFPADYHLEGVSRRERIRRISSDVRNSITAAIDAEGGCRNLPEKTKS